MTRPAPEKKGKTYSFLAMALLVALPAALFAPVFLSGKMIYGFDVITCLVSYGAEAARSLAFGQWPLWMPDILGGMPGIASCDLNFLYPSDLISTLAGWPAATQYGWDALIHVALAGTGMFLFLRRLDRSISASLLGAFFFTASGSVVSQVFGGYYNFVEGVSLVPWTFWAADKGRREASFFAWGLCGLFFSLQILAQAFQIFVYTLPAVAIFSMAREGVRGKNNAADGSGSRLSAVQGLALALGLCFLLAAPQILPTLQYLPLCARQGYSHAEFISGSLGLSEAVTWLVPGFFGWRIPSYHGPMVTTCVTEYFGLLPWILAAGAVSALWSRETRVRWFSVLALAAFFFAQRQWTPFYTLFRHLPVIAGFRMWSRILFLLTFAVCGLAAFGWDALWSRPRRKAALRGILIFSALALAAAALAWVLAPGQAAADAPRLGWFAASLDGAKRTAGILTALARGSAQTTLVLVPLMAALLWFGTRRLGQGMVLLLALAFHVQDQKEVFKRFIQFVDPQEISDRTNFALPPPGTEPWRVFADDAAFPNRAALHGYENLGGLESVPLQSAQRIRAAMERRKQDWLDLMNVRYVFGPPKPGSGDAPTITANPGAFPRAWLATQTRTVSGDEEAYRLLADPAFNPRAVVALDADPGLAPDPGASNPSGSVLWLGRSPQTASLDVFTRRDAVLVLSNAWYPSWRCAVDGRDTPVLKADGGLQAVVLKAGRHRVDFRFDNGLFYDALAACLAGIAALFGLALLEKKGARPRPGS